MIHFKFNFVIVLMMTLVSFTYSKNPFLRRIDKHICLKNCTTGLSKEFKNLSENGLECAKHAIKNMIKTGFMDVYLLHYYESFMAEKYFLRGSIQTPKLYCSNLYLKEESRLTVYTRRSKSRSNRDEVYEEDYNQKLFKNCFENLKIFGMQNIWKMFHPQITENYYFDIMDVLRNAFYNHKQCQNKNEAYNNSIFPPGTDGYKYLDHIAQNLSLNTLDESVPSPQEFCEKGCKINE